MIPEFMLSPEYDYQSRLYAKTHAAELFYAWFVNQFIPQNPVAAEDFNFSWQVTNTGLEVLAVESIDPFFTVDALESMFYGTQRTGSCNPKPPGKPKLRAVG